MKIKRDTFRSIMLLGLLVLGVYGSSLFFSFIWDDKYLIVENPFIKHLRYLPNLFSGDLTQSTNLRHHAIPYFRPLSMTSFMLDYQLWGLNAFGFHLTNLLLHWGNSIFVFMFILFITKNRRLSLIASCLFAVHPIHVEAVAPVFNRMGIQATFFMLLSMLLFLYSKELTRKLFVIFTWVMFFCALLSKEEAVVLPLLLAGCDYYFLSGQDWKVFKQRKRIVFYGVMMSILFVFMQWRQASTQWGIGHYFSSEYVALASNMIFHLLTVIKICADYIVKSLIPLNLSALYWIEPIKSIAQIEIWGSLVLIVLLIAYFILINRRNRTIGFFILFFMAVLLPFTNLIPIAEAYTFHDRFLYLPVMSICFFMAFLLDKIYSQERFKQVSLRLKNLLVVALIFSLGCMSYVESLKWKNELTLWVTEVEKNPQSQLAYLNLSDALLNMGRVPEAKAAIERSLSVSSMLSADGVYYAKLNLAKIYIESGQSREALIELQDTIRIAEQYRLNPYSAYDKLGLFYAGQNDPQAAEKSFLKAIELNPRFTETIYNLAVLMHGRGELGKAKEFYLETIALDPDFSLGHLGLGLVHLSQNKANEARESFKKALLIDPRLDMARKYLQSLEK